MKTDNALMESNTALVETNEKLSVEQLNAIDLLLVGHSDREVSEKVNVNRSTVTQWRNHHAEFIAELNRRRHDLWGSQVERLRHLIEKAVDVLEADLDRDDPKLRQRAAIHILKAVEMYGGIGPPSGSTDPASIEAQWENSKRLEPLVSFKSW